VMMQTARRAAPQDVPGHTRALIVKDHLLSAPRMPRGHRGRFLLQVVTGEKRVQVKMQDPSRAEQFIFPLLIEGPKQDGR